MLDNDERESIINAAVERCLLSIPEVIGNLMTNHIMLHKINRKFYEDHPEFAGRKDIVQAVVESVEGDNFLDDYENILKQSIPEIRRRMGITKTLDVETIPKQLEQSFNDVNLSDNGSI